MSEYCQDCAGWEKNAKELEDYNVQQAKEIKRLKAEVERLEAQLAAAVRAGELLYHNMDTKLFDRKDTAMREWKKAVAAYDAAKEQSDER